MSGQEIWNIIVKGQGGRPQNFQVPKDCTIGHLFKEIRDHYGQEHLRVLFGHTDLRDDNPDLKLSHFHITNGATLVMAVRLVGGFDVVSELVEKNVKLTDLPKYCTVTTTDMDIWTLETDVKCAKMQCGHAISPESMTIYARSILGVGKYIFPCPGGGVNTKDCVAVWPYFVVRHVACLSPKEQTEFETKLAENYINRSKCMQSCPGCSTYCFKENIKHNRVVCPICTKEKQKTFEFCWVCLQTWNTSGQESCGNKSCSGRDQRYKVLENCRTTKTIGMVAGCYEARSCPNCGIVIFHDSGCKHMICTACETEFCFVCLKLRIDEKWPTECGSWNNPCKVAPLQTKIVGAE